MGRLEAIDVLQFWIPQGWSMLQPEGWRPGDGTREKRGKRPTLVQNIICYSGLQLVLQYS